MVSRQSDSRLGRAVKAQLVRHQHLGREALPLEQLAHQCRAVARASRKSRCGTSLEAQWPPCPTGPRERHSCWPPRVSGGRPRGCEISRSSAPIRHSQLKLSQGSILRLNHIGTVSTPIHSWFNSAAQWRERIGTVHARNIVAHPEAIFACVTNLGKIANNIENSSS